MVGNGDNMKYDGLASYISSDPVCYERFFGSSFGHRIDEDFPEHPTLEALYEGSKEHVDLKHLQDPNFLRGALEGVIAARQKRKARL